jgi:hypothetical protein
MVGSSTTDTIRRSAFGGNGFVSLLFARRSTAVAPVQLPGDSATR